MTYLLLIKRLSAVCAPERWSPDTRHWLRQIHENERLLAKAQRRPRVAVDSGMTGLELADWFDAQSARKETQHERDV